MSKSRWYSVVIDANDVHALASFWQEALGYHRTYEAPDEVVLTIDEAGEREPGLVFVQVPDAKAAKNRMHIDFAPDDRDAEVERLLALGATRAQVGQTGEETWVVLADPEGNEFCVLSAR